MKSDPTGWARTIVPTSSVTETGCPLIEVMTSPTFMPAVAAGESGYTFWIVAPCPLTVRRSRGAPSAACLGRELGLGHRLHVLLVDLPPRRPTEVGLLPHDLAVVVEARLDEAPDVGTPVAHAAR